MASQYQPGVGSLILAIDRADIITTNSNIVRDDQKNLKVWVSKSAIPSTPDPSTLLWDAEGLQATIVNLEVEKTHYFRYALTSALDPTIYTISSQYSFIPRASLVANTSDIPPDPKGIVAAGAVSSILVTLPTATVPGITQSTDYGGGDYVSGSTLALKASSRHKSTVVYGKVVNSLLDEPAFSAVQSNILGEFEEKTVFTLPADPGTCYALYFKYKNKAGNVSANAQGPVMVETGINVQKFLDMLANEITEGQLFKGLQTRLSRTDRVPQVDVAAGQYSVKIDNGGAVAGFGLSNTSRSIGYSTSGSPTGLLSDGIPFSEFGIVANRFWISGAAIQSDTRPTTGLYQGARWLNTSVAGNNEGVVVGPIVWYDIYGPTVHNEITLPGNPTFWYWQLKTKTELEKLIFSGVTYTDRGKFIVGTSYSQNDYVFDQESGIYYICLKSFTPVKLSNFATKDPKIIGGFTASGATIVPGKVIFAYGAETPPTATTAGAGTGSGYKMPADYRKLDAGIYYVTSVTGSTFVLSLKPGGEPVVTGITPTLMYYNIPLKPNPEWEQDKTKPKEIIDTAISEEKRWVPEPVSGMFPFIVETGTSAGIRPGVYMDAAYIKDASITNAKIADASIDSAKITSLDAGKITAGKIKADLIDVGAITVRNVDISSLRGRANDTWIIAMPILETTEISKTIDLPPGDYELVLTSTFGRIDEYLGSNTFKEEAASITAEVTGVTGATVTALGYWKKTVDSTKLDIKIKNKLADITTAPTYTFSGGVTADIPPGPPGPPGPPAPPSGGGGEGGGGGGGGGCLAYGTPILMQDGIVKNIEDLQVGDMIKSIIIEDLSTEENAWKDYSTSLFSCSPTVVTVTGVRLDTFHSYYNINNNLLKITYEHPLLVRRNSEYRFIQSIELVTGDFIYHETNGWIQVTSIEFINESLQTVSIDTEFEDVYFANGILVHNATEKN